MADQSNAEIKFLATRQEWIESQAHFYVIEDDICYTQAYDWAAEDYEHELKLVRKVAALTPLAA